MVDHFEVAVLKVEMKKEIFIYFNQIISFSSICSAVTSNCLFQAKLCLNLKQKSF
jgi:hypothetical protein